MTATNAHQPDDGFRPESPPFANRGGETFEELGMEELGGSLDWLTISLRREEAAWSLNELRKWLRRHGMPTTPEAGKPRPGFARSEAYRLSDYGDATLWRRLQPRAASITLGDDYEGWEVAGCASMVLRDILMDAPQRYGRASRVDVAFDFARSEDLWPRHVEEAITAHAEARGFSIRYAGERDERTVYIGSKQSGRRLRIYRHDLRHDGMFPLMRVELELTGKRFPRELWSLWSPDPHDALTLAAGHVFELSGRAPMLPIERAQPEESPSKHLVRAAVAAVKSYGTVLRAFHEAGGDLVRLMGHGVRPDDREQRRREKLYSQSVQGWTSDSLHAAVLQGLGGGPGSSALETGGGPA